MPVETISDKQAAEEMIKNARLLVVHFYADWVLQCSHMHDSMVEMSKLPDFSPVVFCRLPAEEVPHISLQYNVSAVPTVILFRDGSQIDRIEGANPAALRDSVKAMVGTLSERERIPDITSVLKELINSASVMLFMKGSAEQPRCGFSRQIIEILLSHGAKFKTFDILSDQQVREALKVYSSWPTYPQLYIRGELIGGLDIVKEMAESGELAQSLPKSVSLETRLQNLINSSEVMVFMKGNKESPRCGFSRQLVQLLHENKVDFSTFDILEDDDVRQGLKEYSKWPTYPQLYVKGRLVGGLDICKELHESGQFRQELLS